MAWEYATNIQWVTFPINSCSRPMHMYNAVPIHLSNHTWFQLQSHLFIIPICSHLKTWASLKIGYTNWIFIIIFSIKRYFPSLRYIHMNRWMSTTSRVIIKIGPSNIYSHTYIYIYTDLELCTVDKFTSKIIKITGIYFSVHANQKSGVIGQKTHP